MANVLGSILLSALVTTWLSASAYAVCSPVPGADALLWTRSVAVVWVGEMHGTIETPAAFGALVCDALAHSKKVTVGLELASGSQAAIDAMVGTEDLEVAEHQLLATPNWHLSFDGRSSKALLALLIELREFRREHSSLRVVAIEKPWENTPGAKEVAVSDGVKSAMRRGPAEVLLVLTGNTHAMKHSPMAYPTAASLLPPAEVFTLLVTARGGQAWLLTGAGCGEQPGGPREKDTTRGFGVYPDSSYTKYGYDGVFSLGTITTASAPADEAAAASAECRKQFLAQTGPAQN